MTTTEQSPRRTPEEDTQHHVENAGRVGAGVFNPRQLWTSLPDALRKLNPKHQLANPVMFVVWVGSALVTVFAIADPSVFNIGIALWLWFTVLFANLAEAVAEGRGKAQAESLRRTKKETVARRLRADGTIEEVPGAELKIGDRVVVEAGQVIPGDGDVVEGIATVDESAITGESAPVIRESGGDRSAVTGGTTVLSDRIVVHITTKPGESFVDRMIALVEGASRQKTPNEIALTILLAVLTIIFLLAVVALQPMAVYSGSPAVGDRADRAAGLPDPDDDRRAAVGDRHRRDGPAGAAQRAGHVRPRGRGRRRRGHVAAGQDRHHHLRQPAGATELIPVGSSTVDDLAIAARLSSLADGTPEGRSIIDLCAREHVLRHRSERGREVRRIRALHRADPDERHQPGRPDRAQGRGQRGARAGSPRTAAPSPMRCTPPST